MKRKCRLFRSKQKADPSNPKGCSGLSKSALRCQRILRAVGPNFTDAFTAVKDISSKVVDKATEFGKDAIDKSGDAYDAIKDGSSKVIKKIHEAIVAADKKRLSPIYLENLNNNEYTIPEMVRVVEYDKQHMENEACEGSIGFFDKIAGASVLTIYKKQVKNFNINFYPNVIESLYYLTPFQTNRYVEYSDYFAYEEKQRLTELNTIAHALGAKYFKVTIMEEQTKTFSVAMKGDSNLSFEQNKMSDKIDAGFDKKELQVVKIGSELRMQGNNNPVRPELKYFAKDEDILSLINMRMDSNNPISSKEIYLNYNSASIVKMQEAMQIDAAIEKFKLKSNNSFCGKVEQENRRKFQYYIEFGE